VNLDPAANLDRAMDGDHALRVQPDEDVADLYDNAPCGYLSTDLDGTIVRINATLLGWLGRAREDVVGKVSFSELLTVGGRMYHETHFAPLLRMQGEVRGVALELRTATGGRLAVLVTSVVRPATGDRPALIRTTVFDARDRRDYERELLRARQDADRDRERLRVLVAGLQRSLLPAVLPTPPGMRTAAHYHMASPDEVGGDFYDLFELPDGRWAFFLGDVCGKGVHAAAVTARARYTLRAAAVYDPSPAAVLGNLNTVLCQDSDTGPGDYCTVVFGLLTPTETGYRADLAGGGHPPALLLGADGSVQPQPTTGGTIIGLLPKVPIATRAVELGPGDTLLLYTDGITEARTPTGRFGGQALQDFAGQHAAAGAAGVIDALTGLLGTLAAGIDDDTALLALQVLPAPVAEP
jgi:sigma-B regulation protein RsbU (phosphoserine phosphatase)